jgi:hypothetical protein
MNRLLNLLASGAPPLHCAAWWGALTGGSASPTLALEDKWTAS